MKKKPDSQVLPSVCPLDCPDTCSLAVRVEGGQLTDVRGSSANPYTDGVICNKVVRSYGEFVHGKNRLTRPLKRTGARGTGSYEAVSWAEALDLVHDGFSRAIKQHGPQAVMPLNYSGPHGELAGGSLDRRFFYALGATLLDRGPLCGAVRGAAYASLFGEVSGMPPEQAVHSDLILVWGNNVTVSNLHLAKILKNARKKGAKLVIIDPKRIKIAEQCDLHLQIHPGTDVVLAMAMAAELERRNALDLSFIEKWVHGFEPYMTAARKYTGADVEALCGLPLRQFDQLVELFCEAKNITTSIGNGIERGASGGSGLRAAMALQALSGNHGRPGAGVMAKSGLATPKRRDRLQRPDLIHEGTRTFNIVDVPEKLLDKTLDPPVMAVMIYNHNPVCTHPDQTNMIRALQREDLFVAGCDVVMTDSLRYADVILPAASHFEYDDIYGAYGQNYLQRAAPVLPRVGDALPNTEIFRRLATRFGFDDPLFHESDEQLMDTAINGDDPHLAGVRPSQIPLDKAIEIRHLDGSDLVLCDNLLPATKSGKVELYSDDLQKRFGCGVPRFVPVSPDLPFTLISPSSAKRTNATFGGCAPSDGLEIVEMHPDDARDRGLTEGQIVEVSNERGRVILKLKITNATRKSVLYSAKGTWIRTSETGQTVNALIPSKLRADLAEGACYNETFVDVKPHAL